MTITPLFIYICDLLNNLSHFALVIGVIAGLCLFATAFLYCFACEEYNPGYAAQAYKKPIKTEIIVLSIAICIKILVPSGNVLAAMYIIPPIVNSEAVQTVPAEAVNLLRDYMQSLSEGIARSGHSSK